MSVFVLEGSGRKWIGVKKLKKLKNKGRRKRKLVLTMDDKFSSSLHRRRERQSPGRQMIFLVVASAADVATGGRNHYRIEGGADQFGVVILGRRNQLQCARRVAPIHRHLKGKRKRNGENVFIIPVTCGFGWMEMVIIRIAKSGRM